jgi:5-methylcytosine-specific restriction protein A
MTPSRPTSHHRDLRRIQGASASSIEDAARRKADPSQAAADALVHTGRWHQLRALILAREPLCRVCFHAGRTTIADSVDHIVPRQAAPDLAYVESNLQPLCDRCHASKSAMERTTGAYRVAVDRSPYDAERRATAGRTREFPPKTTGDSSDA